MRVLAGVAVAPVLLGVTLSAPASGARIYLAARGGFAGKDLRVYASNGYFTTIRASDYMNEPIMLAYSADGQAITTLQKGPLTVVLPAQPARLHTTEYGAAWVWYVERIAPLT